MLFKETVQMAISALWANKMRSLLTMLGIIIGVGAVIAMVSIGMGVRKQVEDSIAIPSHTAHVCPAPDCRQP